MGPNYGSYAVIGYNEEIDLLNKTLAKYYKRDYGMVAASGFLACQNIVEHLIQANQKLGKTMVLMDQRSHPSLRSGSHTADRVLYNKHNDIKDARRILEENAKNFANKIVLIESVYSTDGDIGDLPAFRKL